MGIARTPEPLSHLSPPLVSPCDAAVPGALDRDPPGPYCTSLFCWGRLKCKPLIRECTSHGPRCGLAVPGYGFVEYWAAPACVDDNHMNHADICLCWDTGTCEHWPAPVCTDDSHMQHRLLVLAY